MTACPLCKHAEVRVLHTDGARRRRECRRCRHRWTTVEVGEQELARYRQALEAARRLAAAGIVDESAPAA